MAAEQPRTAEVGGADLALALTVVACAAAIRASGARRDTERGAWVGQHVTRMGAAYIATVSAFSAVNFDFLPTAARWLWPTLLGSPLLAYAVRRYERRFGVD